MKKYFIEYFSDGQLPDMKTTPENSKSKITSYN